MVAMSQRLPLPLTWRVKDPSITTQVANQHQPSQDFSLPTKGESINSHKPKMTMPCDFSHLVSNINLSFGGFQLPMHHGPVDQPNPIFIHATRSGKERSPAAHSQKAALLVEGRAGFGLAALLA